MPEYPLQRIAQFVSQVAPFDSLAEDELQEAVDAMEIAFFPAGEAIIRVGGEPSRYLYIIQKGSAKVSAPGPEGSEGDEILVDIRGEGDTFGALSLLHARRAIFNVTAREDLICYLLPAEDFRRLVDAHPAFEGHYGFSLARNLAAVRDGGQGMPRATGLDSFGLEALLTKTPVAELMSREVLTCHPATPARTAARRMSERQVGSMVVVDETGHPVGIVTDSDFRGRLVAGGLGFETPVAEFMSPTVHAIAPTSLAFEALLDMSRHGVKHLVVEDAGRMAGIIADRDLSALTGSSPVGIVSDIAKVASVDELVGLHRRIDRVLEMLLRLGGSARTMLELVTEFNDRVTMKLIELVEEEMDLEGAGRPPVPYVWMALGSEGRREQTLRTDQDNALIYARVPEEREQPVKEWFLGFAGRIVAGLERCGFPRCQGGIMAVNPRWCQNDLDWQHTFLGWVNDPNPQTLRLASIFFDYRAIYAEADFLDALTDILVMAIEGNRFFLRALARNALYNRPPLGFFRQFVVEKDGEHRNKLNLKLSGLTPVVDAARVMTLDQGLLATNTLDRLDQVSARGLLKPSFAAEVIEAFNFITILRVTHHLEARSRGEVPDNFVDPAELNGLQRKMLKESFAVISQLQDQMEHRYQTQLMS